MKKTAIVALALVMTASAGAQSNKKKNKVQPQTTTQTQAPVQLSTQADSLSYAAGKMVTQGLVEYLTSQLKVDASQMSEVIRGLQETLGETPDAKKQAYRAGTQVAQMVQDRIKPNVTKQMADNGVVLNNDLFVQGFLNALQNTDSTFTVEKAATYFQQMMEAKTNAKNEAYKKENEAWLEANKTKAGVKTTASGLQYKVITEGRGIIPKADDEVVVKYEGKTIDGNVFDSSYQRNPQTTEFRCNQVIKGWTEALTMMPVGSKWELYIPQQLAYGAQAAGDIKPFSTLIFTVELVDIKKPEANTETAKPAETKPAKKPATKKRTRR